MDTSPHPEALTPEQHQQTTPAARLASDVARPSVLFLCVHNAGRSQMAAGWLRHLAGDAVDVFSGGSEPAASINAAAVEAMAEAGIDISTEHPKRWSDEVARTADVVVTMGCGDACPIFPGTRYEDWELADPAGQSLQMVRGVRNDIERRVRAHGQPRRSRTGVRPSDGAPVRVGARPRRVASPLTRRLVAEFVGTLFLVAGVVGSGIMAQRLSTDPGLQLLQNTAATAGVLVALILALGPASGAHLNPAVTLVDRAFGGIDTRSAARYIAAQVTGAIAGSAPANLVHDLPAVEWSTTARAGTSGSAKASPPSACSW